MRTIRLFVDFLAALVLISIILVLACVSTSRGRAAVRQWFERTFPAVTAAAAAVKEPEQTQSMPDDVDDWPLSVTEVLPPEAFEPVRPGYFRAWVMLGPCSRERGWGARVRSSYLGLAECDRELDHAVTVTALRTAWLYDRPRLDAAQVGKFKANTSGLLLSFDANTWLYELTEAWGSPPIYVWWGNVEVKQ